MSKEEYDINPLEDGAVLVDSVGEEEDDIIFSELREKAQAYGYTVTDDMTSQDLQYLIDRIDRYEGKEDSSLKAFIAAQAETTLRTKEDLISGYATLLSRETEDNSSINANIFSADVSLGQQLSKSIREWVMQEVIHDPSVTDDKIYESYMEAGQQFGIDTALKGTNIYRYIRSLHPLYTSLFESEIEHHKLQSESRSRLATSYIADNVSNDKLLQEAEHAAIIRQVIKCSNGTYETVCPVCGKRTKLSKYVLRIMAYATENGVARHAGAIFNGCQTTGCNTALLLPNQEYGVLVSEYSSKCKDIIDSYIAVAKKSCAGAAVMFSKIPFDFISTSIPGIYLEDGAGQVEKKPIAEKEDKVIFELISDEEMLNAAKRFYMKLPGITNTIQDSTVTHVVEADGTVSTVSTVPIEKVQEVSSWNYHDVAVYMTQCLSKDYLTEKSRALFSLALSIQSNPFLAEVLSVTNITSLQNTLCLLSRYSTLKNPRALTISELVEIRSSLARADIATPNDSEKVLEIARESKDKIKQKLQQLIKHRDEVIAQLYQYEKLLAFTKIVKVNSCKLSDLTILLQTDAFAEFTNRVADRMIISNYADAFCDYWSTLGVVKSSLIDSICNTDTNSSAVQERLQKLTKADIISNNALIEMQPIYYRMSNLSEALHQMYQAYITADYVAFCNAIHKIPTDYVAYSVEDKALFRMLQDVSSVVASVTHKSKAEVYLSKFFSDEEILGCERCNDILFGRYVLVPEESESIDQYCDRSSNWNGVLRNDLEVYDTFNFFKPFEKYGVLISVCSLKYDIATDSFGKSIFMNSILSDVCSRLDSMQYANSILKVSVMQQHIARTVPTYLNKLGDYYVVSRVCRACYFTSLYNLSEVLQQTYSDCDVKADSLAEDLSKKYGFAAVRKYVSQALDNMLNEDGEPIADYDEAMEEFQSYAEYTGMKEVAE